MENREYKKEYIMYRVKIVQQDITKLEVNAIVNAANKSLLGGGGVDGAIHMAAGKELLDFCRTLNGCETGEAKLSPGFLLPAKYVIHTVGPRWRGGDKNEPELLSNAYKNSLEIASDKKFNIVAFPNISTGVYGYPKRAAAEIAIKTVVEFLLKNEYPKEVMFIVFAQDNYSLYHEIIHQ